MTGGAMPRSTAVGGTPLLKRPIVWAITAVALVAVAGLYVKTRPRVRDWSESFSTPRLDEDIWRIVASGDFRDRRVDIAHLEGQSRLRVLADTVGTRDDTVKFLGAATTRAFPFDRPAQFDLLIDWNNQANGSYLTAAVVLSPHQVENPLASADWLKVEYVGVPPGRNARMVIARRTNGQLQTLHTEGWPQRNAGRAIGEQRLRIEIGRSGLTVVENGQIAFQAERFTPPFSRAHVYLLISSHSNYRARTVYFDDLRYTSL